jgi:4-hydroxybenzoate polyprenyltransferase
MIKIPVKYLKPLDYFFIFRPTLFFPIWIITLSGLVAGRFFNGDPVWWSFHVNWRNLLAFFFITLTTGATFILNQLQDVESDKINKKLFLISEQYVREEVAQKIALVSIGVSLVGISIVNVKLLPLIIVLLIFCGYLYNYQPFQWKNKPILGIVVNYIGGLCLFLCGWVMANNFQWMALKYSIPYLLAWTSIAILTTIPDRTGDQNSDKVTISVRLKNRTTTIISFGFLIISFGLSLYFQDPIISLPILLTIPLFLVTIYKPTIAWILRTIRYPILFLALMLCCEFPLFFIVILINFYLCKVYYVYRFGLNYPTFHVEEE